MTDTFLAFSNRLKLGLRWVHSKMTRIDCRSKRSPWSTVESSMASQASYDVQPGVRAESGSYIIIP
ncbi:hypothetical protein CH63R_06382 [Colletotrichum higginsianum IMI 349063]|uniref:Uncharacterized protein n=1 Tax=Colletotrichum higginsianum (strain IMI 349063) TaxID=759273 RepID=A0A1B7YFH6_COLHI|nr:hypothetical protein CH63R_06382 [Colletotrichum higginsianum IMI 349063]OBR10690.1 hypothetical protein CH63R_06382 [Colletotrichum higginsianum IMI 349063]